MSDFSYRLTIQYKGTNYSGWQIQKDSSQKTIQGELFNAFSSLLKINKDEIKIVGAGRTDAGVHALAQVARVDLPISLPENAFLKGVNSLLNPEIIINDVVSTNMDFHPIRDSKWKEYAYVFSFNKANCFENDLITFCNFDCDDNLLFDAAKIFIGEHDFVNYYCTGSEFLTSKKEIFDCSITKYEKDGLWSNLSTEYYVLKIRGNGFLKQMVRLIVGTIWSAAQGNCSLDDIRESLKVKKNKRLGIVAPANGLYMSNIKY